LRAALGPNFANIGAVIAGSEALDINNQFPGVAYVHAMRDFWQSPVEAKAKACKLIRDKMGEYVRLSDLARRWNDPKMRARALSALGQALHPVMDSTSPAHRGWRLWNPFDVPGILSRSIETIDALTPALLAETVRRIRDVMNGADCDCVLQ